MFQQTIDSPLGDMQIFANEQGLLRVTLGKIVATPDASSALTRLAAEQLEQYFYGDLTTFNLPLAATGTPFQQQVWQALCQLPYGTTCSYASIADSIAKPKAVRAVGAANGRNPLAIVVPCHRVIGANGSLTGYAGGLRNKAWLLQHEQRLKLQH
ncbi:methylated-DNA--[protein]-cysteine S-methyltransferase [Arsukibacterium sp. UBA3155]|uniref:methylated-DNA--[protein]-cysteine S-methyltransferase n=1 Tax=Arsukibacterium sp. UBA3155 TaxID=1946058 RepID=UPI0025C315DD|nr:methylated-DNA--[protein]-cysteine S-methyltransferase [Arsukibacterium sp. UBA3155]|tara:strand:- start:201622 stop:202086 length:465 start_codon:yes stop_codon:yes gene_type:complete